MLKLLIITLFILLVISFIFVVWIKNRQQTVRSFTIPTFMENKPEHLVDEDQPPTFIEVIKKFFGDKNDHDEIDDSVEDE